jgi:hypothetical protein
MRRLWLGGGDRAARPDSTRLSSVPVPGLRQTVQRVQRRCPQSNVAFTDDLSDELIDRLVEGAASFSSPLSLLGLFYMHGAATRVPTTATSRVAHLGASAAPARRSA